MKKYTITVTEEQAFALVEATEILARLGIGQFQHALEYLPLIKRYPNGWFEDMEIIGQLLAAYTIGGINGYNSSLGIHADQVSEQAKIAWDLYQVIRHRLSWDQAVKNGIVKSIDSPRNLAEMFQVYYDDPTKTSKQPLATITKVEE